MGVSLWITGSREPERGALKRVEKWQGLRSRSIKNAPAEIRFGEYLKSGF